MQLPSARSWSVTSCIQAAWVASSPRLWERAPHKTSSATVAPSLNTSTATRGPPPLIVHASESTSSHPSPSTLSSPLTKSPSIVFATFAGAGAISLITLTCFYICWKYKNKFGSFLNLGPNCTASNGHFGVNKRRSKVEKGDIRHITHEEQKERYKSLFGVPAGYLRPKSRISPLEPRPLIRHISVAQYPQYFPDGQDTIEKYPTYPSSHEFSNGEALPFEIIPDEFLERVGGERKSGALRFDEESTLRTRYYDPNGDARKLPPFAERLPQLTSCLKVIKDKAMYKGQSLQTQTFTSKQAMNSCASQTDFTAEEIDVPKSPSIVPTPPYYLKSPSHLDSRFENPPDLGSLVTEGLNRKVAGSRASHEGRGESYYWKVSPIVNSPEK